MKNYNLSQNALMIAKTADQFYKKTQCSELTDLDQFHLNDSELNSACQELDDAGLAWIETGADGKPYLYINYECTRIMDD